MQVVETGGDAAICISHIDNLARTVPSLVPEHVLRVRDLVPRRHDLSRKVRPALGNPATMLNIVREDRLAGHPEQIAVLCEHVEDAAHAVAIAGRIIEAFRTPLVLRDLELTVPVSVSVGIALSADPGADPDQLLAHADAAM